MLDHVLLFELTEDIFDLFFDCIWVEFIRFNYMRKLSFYIKLVELLDDVFVKLRDSDFILANVDNTVLLKA